MLAKFFMTDKVMTSLAREAMTLKVEAAKLHRDVYMYRCLAEQFKLRPSFQNPVKYTKSDGKWVCSYDDGEEDEGWGMDGGDSLQAIGRTPEEAAVHFDLVWFGMERHFED